MASSWGRKETLITPPTVPVYTFTAFGVALMCLCFFAWQRVAFSMPIMQRSYFTEYVRAAVGLGLPSGRRVPAVLSRRSEKAAAAPCPAG